MSRPRRSFTLVEVMMAIGASSLVLAAAWTLLSFGARTTGRAGGTADAVDSVGTALLHIGARLRYCQDVVTPGGGAEADHLEFSSVSTGGWKILVRDRQLIVEEAHGFEKKILSDGIDKVRFSRAGTEDDVVRVELTVGTGATARIYRTSFFARGTRRPPWS